MRIIIAVLVLIFSLQSWTKADDILDLQIEGLSIGDSLLDHFSEPTLEKYKKDYYPKSDKYYEISIVKQVNITFAHLLRQYSLI